MPSKLASCSPIVVQLGDRDAEILLPRKRRLVLNQHEAITIRVRERFEQHAVDDAEDRRVGADAQAEGDDRDGGEARALAKRSRAVFQVLHEVLEPAHTARVTCFFLVLFHGSKVPHRSCTRRLGGHALANVLFGFHLDVKAHFRIELPVHAGAVPHGAHLVTKAWFHRGSSLSVDSFSSRPTPAPPRRPSAPTARSRRAAAARRFS